VIVRIPILNIVVTTRSKIGDIDDTIVALSSAAGPGARAIVRLSGSKATTIARSICPDFQPAPGRICTVQLHLSAFRVNIPADVYHLAAPRTYTGQDVVEIHTVASEPIVDVLIADCLGAGARAAEPGEFTLRAFLAGKLDLTRAEAVLGVIEARDRRELHDALKQLAHGVAIPLCALRDDLLDLLADVEAGLDFAEEDLRFVTADDLARRLSAALGRLTLLRKQIEERSLGRPLFRVVLAGKPNAGKSSLFNALVGKDAALVSAEPATTRDFLEAIIEIGGVRFALVDTAGEQAAKDLIESDAQRVAGEQVQHADLVLWCTPCDEPSDAVNSKGLRTATKADLAVSPVGVLAVSAVTGDGIEELRRKLAAEATKAGQTALAPSLSRCRHHLDACLQHLERARTSAAGQSPHEILALDLRLALEELGAMAGAVYTEDLLDRVFSRFCIGK
jgi:tRNA modification GTPase